MTSSEYPGLAGTWAPVIYGKTYRVDEWWRALPAGVTRGGPVAGVIKGAIADGRVPAPRFVLARLDAGTLVGVVSSAAGFGTEMAADSFGRPLYCFVGWYSREPGVAVPSFAELTGGWERLVLAEYDRVMLPVWQASAEQARVPAVLEPDKAPWPTPIGQRLTELPAFLSDAGLPGDTVRVYPSASADLVWQAVADHGVRAAAVTGWETYQSAIRPYLTHVCADNFDGPSPLVLKVPPRAAPAAPGRAPREQTRPEHQPGPGHGYGYEQAGHGAGRHGGGSGGGEREAAGSGGVLSGGVRALKRAAQAGIDILSGGEPALPGDPPRWAGAWTFRQPATFEATDGPYVFWYTIGERAIHCADRTGQELEWTGSHWIPAAPAQPKAQPPAQPKARPARDLLDQPPVTGLGTVSPQAPPSGMREKLNTTFSGFGRPTRDREAGQGTSTAAGPGEREGGTGAGGAGPDAGSPPESGQPTSP